METVYVVEGLRTPFGSFGGGLAGVAAPQLAATVMKGILEGCSLSPEAVDEVIAGQVLSGGVGQAPARQAMRAAGIPDAAAALTVNKVCGSGLKAIMLGADSIRVGNSDIVLAGGMENMSSAPFVLKKARSGLRMGHSELQDLMIYDGLTDPYSGRHMGEIGDMSAERCGVSREEQDEFALRSYRLARAAATEGRFDREIVPVRGVGKNRSETITADEEPFKADLDRLNSLRPAFNPDGTITAGNASGICDGAAFCLLAGANAIKKHKLTPKAWLVSSATASRPPEYFPEAPIDAIQKVCSKVGLSPEDIDLFEINEAFASVPLTAAKALNLDPERINVNGGACALGHPIGASGGRLVATLISELHRRKARYGLATICIGGGEAVAMIFERV